MEGIGPCLSTAKGPQPGKVPIMHNRGAIASVVAEFQSFVV